MLTIEKVCLRVVWTNSKEKRRERELCKDGNWGESDFLQRHSFGNGSHRDTHTHTHKLKSASTVEPLYNEVIGTMKITLLYQVSHYIRVQKQRNIKSWDQQNYLVIRGFCYIRPLYNEVPLYIISGYYSWPTMSILYAHNWESCLRVVWTNTHTHKHTACTHHRLIKRNDAHKERERESCARMETEVKVTFCKDIHLEMALTETHTHTNLKVRVYVVCMHCWMNSKKYIVSGG